MSYVGHRISFFFYIRTLTRIQLTYHQQTDDKMQIAHCQKNCFRLVALKKDCTYTVYIKPVIFRNTFEQQSFRKTWEVNRAMFVRVCKYVKSIYKNYLMMFTCLGRLSLADGSYVDIMTFFLGSVCRQLRQIDPSSDRTDLPPTPLRTGKNTEVV